MQKMSIYKLGLTLGVVLSVLGASATSVLANEPPNILLVIADDMGLDASPCYDVGADKPDMPFIERMCAEGVVFDNFYVAPVCSPTRATIATGRFGFRTGVGTAVSPRSSNSLPLSETTIFQYLDANAPQDYAHAVIGKWHLANQANGDEDHPNQAGVGYYAGVLEGTIEDYYDWPRTFEGHTENVQEYITSALTDEAVDWVNTQDDPWFLWLAHVAPHLPFHLPPENLHTHTDLSGTEADMKANPLDYYLASLEALDTELGRLISSMSQADQDNLVVIFIGDNGSPNRVAQSPYSRGQVKGSLFEGGVHAPMIVWGAGVDRHGVREDGLVNSTDLFATIAELAGIRTNDAAPQDSLSFKSALSEEGRIARDYVYVEHFADGGPSKQSRQQFGWAVRDADWKYLSETDGPESLFNLSVDPFETNDLLASGALDSEAAAALKRLMEYGEKLRSN